MTRAVLLRQGLPSGAARALDEHWLPRTRVSEDVVYKSLCKRKHLSV